MNCSPANTRANSERRGADPARETRYPYSEERSRPSCFTGSTPPEEDPCSENANCDTANRQYAHLIEIRVVEGPNQATDWQWVRIECRTTTEPEAPSIAPGDVMREFRRLSWPAATLILEPATDFALVNRATAARASNDGPQIRDVILLGQRVHIEATPQTWTWHWDDGTTDTTDYPGQPHPHTTITHTWPRAALVSPRVDITYRGRYRTNDGPWQPLPGTHTVRGPETTLEVVQAAAQLIR